MMLTERSPSEVCQHAARSSEQGHAELRGGMNSVAETHGEPEMWQVLHADGFLWYEYW